MRVLNYYRRFTEQLPKGISLEVFRSHTPRARHFTELFIIWTGLSFLMLVVVGAVLHQQTRLMGGVRHQEEQQLAYWEHIVQQQPNYPHAYYEIAVHAARLHDFAKATQSIQKSLLLDPNFTQAEVFAQEIQGK